MISSDNPVTDLPAPTFKKDGKPASPLISTPEHARGLHQQNWDADANNRLARAWVQAMMEGRPPNDPALMRAAGLGGCSNINWLDGQLAIRRKMIPYVEILNSLPCFLNIRTNYGTRTQRAGWERKMSEAHAQVMREWRQFVPRYLFNILYLASHGVGFCYFNDCTDWRWHVSTMGEMVIPRLSRSDSSEFQVISTVKEFTPYELWSKIGPSIAANPKSKGWTRGNGQGWNIPATKLKMEKATGEVFFKANDWEKDERLWKGNEYYFTRSAKTCSCILMWVQETDGRVTQLILSEQSCTNGRQDSEEFLFREEGYFSTMEDGMVVFTRDIGTNGYFHSIRGTGSDIMPMVQQINRMKNNMFDALEVEMSIPVSASEEILASELAYTKAGPFMPMYDGMKIMDRKAADYSKSAFPGMEIVTRNFLEQTGQIPAGLPSGANIDIEGILGALSGIDIMEFTLFSIPWQSLLRTSLRRMIRIASSAEPGGKEAFRFRQLCLDAGVPKDAIEKIDYERTTAVRAFGNGSPQSRLFTANALKEVVPMMDETGKNKWLRSYISALPGMSWDQVDELAPEVPDMRPDQQVRNAIYENNMLTTGGQCPVLPNDEHLVHIEQHLVPMGQIVQAVEEGLPKDEAVVPLFPLYLHANEHLTLAQDDRINQQEISAARQALQAMGEIIVNGQREAEAKAQKAEENAQKGLDPDGNPLPDGGGMINGERPVVNGLTPSEYAKLIEAQLKLEQAGRSAQMRDQQHAMEMAAKQQEITDKAAAAKQNRTLADYKTSAQIRGMQQGMRLRERTAQEKSRQMAMKKKSSPK